MQRSQSYAEDRREKLNVFVQSPDERRRDSKEMFFPLLMLLQQQPQLRATQPAYFLLTVVVLLIAGGVGWLIAAVLGFARSPAFVFDYLSPSLPALRRVCIFGHEPNLG
jgi:Flp pilus assembly protein TadB